MNRCTMHGSHDPPCGLLNLDKPTGPTSRTVVDLVSRPLRGVKVGHAGTLDPLASGVLIVCVGRATRLIELVQRMPKTYRAIIRLGATSDTLDADGRITVVESPRIPSDAEVRAVLAGQVGTIQQAPPSFSALRVGGRRAYDLARAGQTLDLPTRPVRIDRIDLLRYEWPVLELEIDCGSGTYIRSIARDVGAGLGCGGLIDVLVRTRIGPFTQADAIDPSRLSREAIPGLLQPPLMAADGLPRISISAAQVIAIGHGRVLEFEGDGAMEVPSGELALLGPGGALVAVGEGVPERRTVRPRIVLTSAERGCESRA